MGPSDAGVVNGSYRVGASVAGASLTSLTSTPNPNRTSATSREQPRPAAITRDNFGHSYTPLN